MPGRRGRGDIAMGDAVTRISPSTDPGTVLLAEMRRNIFPLVFMMKTSLFSLHVLQASVPDPWLVSSSHSQHGDKVGKETKEVADIRGPG